MTKSPEAMLLALSRNEAKSDDEIYAELMDISNKLITEVERHAGDDPLLAVGALGWALAAIAKQTDMTLETAIEAVEEEYDQVILG
jgi:hypothetical protein